MQQQLQTCLHSVLHSGARVESGMEIKASLTTWVPGTGRTGGRKTRKQPPTGNSQPGSRLVRSTATNGVSRPGTVHCARSHVKEAFVMHEHSLIPSNSKTVLITKVNEKSQSHLTYTKAVLTGLNQLRNKSGGHPSELYANNILCWIRPVGSV